MSKEEFLFLTWLFYFFCIGVLGSIYLSFGPIFFCWIWVYNDIQSAEVKPAIFETFLAYIYSHIYYLGVSL